MPNLKWKCLSSLQLGRYAEYYAKMEFASYGFEIYTSEVDDHGVDFVFRTKQTKSYCRVQVKSSYKQNYTFMTKEKTPLEEDFLICYVRFSDDALPEVYIIPAKDWETPNAVLVDRKYSEGQTSKPEWGINYSKKNAHLLDKYRAEMILPNL